MSDRRAAPIVVVVLLVAAAVIGWAMLGPGLESSTTRSADGPGTGAGGARSSGPTTPAATPTISDRAADPTAPAGAPGGDAVRPERGTTGVRPGVVLAPSRSVTVTEDGAVVERLDVSGVINVRADDVTIRDVRVRANAKDFVVNLGTGYHGLLVENVEILLEDGDNEPAAGIGGVGDHAGSSSSQPGDNITVRGSSITGVGDGIKIANYGLYEDNYISVHAKPGSVKHIDGMQSSGRSHWVVRGNHVDQAYRPGHHGAVYHQCYTGSRDVQTYDTAIVGNWLNGGTYTVVVENGKEKKRGAEGAVATCVNGMTIADNVFYRDYLYGVYAPRGEVTGDGGIWFDTGEVVPRHKIKEES